MIEVLYRRRNSWNFKSIDIFPIRERSHMTSAAEGDLAMLMGKGGGGGVGALLTSAEIPAFWQKLLFQINLLTIKLR